jgi:hypothetical protein
MMAVADTGHLAREAERLASTSVKAVVATVVIISLGRGSSNPVAYTEAQSQSGTPGLAAHLDVNVPQVPPTGSLKPLCTRFLAAAKQGEVPRSRMIDELIQATGGQPDLTAAWCQTYLHRSTSRHGS